MNASICDLCKKEIPEISFTIPMDENWERISGMYCSLTCARWDNRMWNRGKRSVEEWEKRDEWMRMRYMNLDSSK